MIENIIEWIISVAVVFLSKCVGKFFKDFKYYNSFDFYSHKEGERLTMLTWKSVGKNFLKNVHK